MQQAELTVVERKILGRARSRSLRRSGQVPVVLYGPHTQPIALQAPEKELGKLVKRARRSNLFVELQMDAEGKLAKRLALVQDIQQHPTTDQLLHIDFREVSLTEKLTATVTIEAKGEAVGLKEGGMLNFVLHQLTVRCLPKDLPDRIEVDVTNLKIGQNIQIGEIVAPPGVEIQATDKTAAVFAMVAPMAEEVAPVAGEAAAEPEVINAKKVEGEEGAVVEGDKGKGESKPAGAKPAAGAAKVEAPKTGAKPGAGGKK